MGGDLAPKAAVEGGILAARDFGIEVILVGDRDVIARELGHLPKETLRKVVRDNVIRLYNLKIDGINN
jgi:fatty acid/phospholipid biosynthesis enzyme